METIKAIRKNYSNLEISLKMTLNPLNVSEIIKTSKEVKKLGFPFL